MNHGRLPSCQGASQRFEWVLRVRGNSELSYVKICDFCGLPAASGSRKEESTLKFPWSRTWLSSAPSHFPQRFSGVSGVSLLEPQRHTGWSVCVFLSSTTTALSKILSTQMCAQLQLWSVNLAAHGASVLHTKLPRHVDVTGRQRHTEGGRQRHRQR